MSYIMYSWLAASLLGVEAVLGKLTSKYSIKNAWLFSFVWSLIILLFTVPIALANHVGVPVEWWNLFMAALFYALSGVFYTLALFALDLSVLSPMWNFRIVFSVILGVFMLGQVLTQWQYGLIAVICISGFFVNMDEHWSFRSFFRKPIVIALIEMLIVAFYGVYTNKSIATNGYWATTLWSEVIAQVMLLVIIPKFWKEIRTITVKQIGALSVMSVAGTTGMLAANAAYAGNVAIASTIISLPVSMVLAFLFSVFAPKLLEKHTMKIYAIRFAAAAVMFIAAIRLTL